ncbi:NADPH-dependent F420 reductase [Kribbella sp. NPDC050124]|uniref:NADPH-dependent F420 reductase n=1 Tax=Kribbella sp. NPDC050124 TaxID=3364114 RepID=UPI0037BE20E5
MSEVVAVLGGTGALGYGLALRLAHAGHTVVIGSRDHARAEEAASRASQRLPSADIRGLANPDAARAADRLVVLSVPLASQAITIATVSEHLGDKVLLDATVPLAPAVGGRPTQVVGLWAGSAGQQAAAAVPEGIAVVSGLHTLSAATLQDLDHPLEQDTLICGDSRAAKDVVREVIGTVTGLRVVDAGRLEMSRLVESLTPLLIGINIRKRTHAGVRIVGLS